jgi:HlyD family secretion protein
MMPLSLAKRVLKLKQITGVSLLAIFVVAGSLTSGMPAIAADTAKAQENKTEAPKPPTISVIAAEKRQIVETLDVSGNFVAREEIMVQPEIDGAAIVEILVDEGDNVKKGQVLARLSSSQIDIQLAQTDANLARSDAAIAQAGAQIQQMQAMVDQAKADLNRTSKLRKSGISTQEQFDQRQAALNSYMAQLESAKQAVVVAQADRKQIQAQRKELELRLARTEIKAPADGFVSRRMARLGSIAAMSQEAMFRIIESGDIELQADVAESDLPRLKTGQPVSISVAGSKERVDGIVRLISPVVNTTTRLGSVRVSLAKGVRVPLGSFGRGMVEIARSQGVSLPLSAVTFKADAAVTQVVKDNKVETRAIKTGLINDEFVEVSEGLIDGEWVVARAGTFVRNGDLITPVKLANQ